jgi:Lon protease-like protein
MQSRVSVDARNAGEVTLSLYGLEFARVRQEFVADSFARQAKVTFGAGASETPLLEETEVLFADLMQRLFESRSPQGSVRNPLFRLQPESWLQATLVGA